MKLVMYSFSLRLASLLGGIATIALSMTHYILIQLYGSYDMIPSNIRILLIILIIIGCLGTVIVKMMVYKPMKKLYPDSDYLQMTLKLFGFPLMQVYCAVILICIFLAVYFCWIGLPQFVIPNIAVCTGLLFYVLGSQFELNENNILGYWLMGTGLVSIPFIHLYPEYSLIWLSITLGGGFILYFIITGFLMTQKKE